MRFKEFPACAHGDFQNEVLRAIGLGAAELGGIPGLLRSQCASNAFTLSMAKMLAFSRLNMR